MHERSKSCCMVAYAFYESDNRVRRYAETLAKAGYHVDAVALRKIGQKKHEIIKGVSVWRIQKREINEKVKVIKSIESTLSGCKTYTVIGVDTIYTDYFAIQKTDRKK